MSKHITEEQRYAISMMLQIPMSKKAIAEAIGVDKSTVYREIKRNCDARSGSYSMEPCPAKSRQAQAAKTSQGSAYTGNEKTDNKALLKKGFSPEQIVGRSRLEGIAMVSHETIYRWIWEDKRRGGKLHKYLRRQGRRYAKRGSKNAGRGFIPGRVDIDERPEIVELKERFGDLEIDTIIGKNHKGAILTINDRATSRVWIRKLSGKEAIPVAKIAVWALRKVKNLIHTITADNGKEFAKHEEIAQKLEIKFYFCKPYHSWERGANENTNGLIRQYIPKGKDFSEVTNKQIKWIENKLNNRPRKRLGYLTPNEKFKQIINQNSVAFAS
ncbi:IS30 family transposase [Bacteroides salyersiae]|nr:IS30 family transposase [Bacteroides salyersiae]